MGTINLDDSTGFLLCHGKGSRGILGKSLENKHQAEFRRSEREDQKKCNTDYRISDDKIRAVFL